MFLDLRTVANVIENTYVSLYHHYCHHYHQHHHQCPRRGRRRHCHHPHYNATASMRYQCIASCSMYFLYMLSACFVCGCVCCQVLL